MSFSDEYKAGLKGESGWGVDTFSYSYQMGAQERAREASSGGGGGGGDAGAGGAAAGGGGIVLVAMLVILAFLAFVASFCTYPIAGFATLIVFLIGSGALSGGGGMNFVGMIFAMMVPCYIVYYLILPLEHKIAKRRPYRVFRHYWRIVVGTYAIHVLGTAFHRPQSYSGGEGVPLSGYLIDAGMTFVGFFLMYLNSRRLDRKWGLEPISTKWIDLLLDPIKNRLIPPIDEGVRTTVKLPAKTASGERVEVSVDGDGMVTLGSVRVPVGAITEFEPEREHRALLLISGVVLFFMGPVMVKGVFGQFTSFGAQFFGLMGIVLSVYLVIITYVQNTPPGKLAGPFRWLNIWYRGPERLQGLKVQFQRAADERLFTQAVANGLKAMPPPEAGAVAASGQPRTGEAQFQAAGA